MTTTTQARIQTLAAPRATRGITQTDTRTERSIPTGLVLFFVLTALFFVLVAVSLSMASQIGA